MCASRAAHSWGDPPLQAARSEFRGVREQPRVKVRLHVSAAVFECQLQHTWRANYMKWALALNVPAWARDMQVLQLAGAAQQVLQHLGNGGVTDAHSAQRAQRTGCAALWGCALLRVTCLKLQLVDRRSARICKGQTAVLPAGAASL